MYVRAGAVLPVGPIKQYADEPSEEPMRLVVYPGADGASSYYEDDGHTFNYRTGEWMRIAMEWRDRDRRLTLRLAAGSRMLAPTNRKFVVRLAGSPTTKEVTFSGRSLEVRL